MRWYWIIAVVVSAVIAMTIGLFEIPDAFFYVALGKWLYTGQVFPILPFNATTPPLLFAPVYALLVTPLQWLPYPLAAITIPFVQVFLVFVSGALLYQIASATFPKPWPGICTVLFLFQPFLLPYATFFMSETVALFGVTVYLWFLWSVYEKKRFAPSILVLCSSILVLTRYAFIPLFAISVLLWIFHIRRPFLSHIPAIMGIAVLLAWMSINRQLYGIFTLSTFTGRHLYNSVVTQARLLPNPTKAQVAGFFEYVPTTPSVVYQPWWIVQPYFVSAFSQKLLSEVQIDRLFLQVSLAAIQQHPQAFFLHMLTMPIRNLTTAPYHDNVLRFMNSSSAPCRFRWETKLCQPPLVSRPLTQLWGRLITGQAAFYPWGTAVLAVVALVGVITALAHKHLWVRMAAITFLVQFVFQSGSEWVEGRFILPLYGFYTLFLVMGLVAILRLVQIPPHPHQVHTGLPYQRQPRK